MSRRHWCDTCRGDGAKDDALLRCASCPRRFHLECAGLRAVPGAGWACPHCVADDEDAGSDRERGKGKKGAKRRALKRRVAAVRKCHRDLAARSRACVGGMREALRPFARGDWADRRPPSTEAGDGGATGDDARAIGPAPPFVRATLRSYQVTGVNFLLGRYALGTGAIVGEQPPFSMLRR